MSKVISNNLPKMVTIFSKEFSITYVEEFSEVDRAKEESLYGQVDYRTNSIRIYKPKDYSLENTWHILLHEIVHIIKDNMNVDFQQDEEERIIDNFALGFMHLCFANKLNFS